MRYFKCHTFNNSLFVLCLTADGDRCKNCLNRLRKVNTSSCRDSSTVLRFSRCTFSLQELVRSNRALELPAPLVPSGDELEQMERASASAAEVTRSTLVQRMELDEKKRTVAMLQKALVSGREERGSGREGRGSGREGRGSGREGRGSGREGRGSGREGRGSGPEGRGSGPEGRGSGHEGRGSGCEGRGSGREGRGSGPEGRGSGREGRGSGREGRGSGREGRGSGREGRGSGPEGRGSGREGWAVGQRAARSVRIIATVCVRGT